MKKELAKRLCFESKLAEIILNNPDYFSEVINKVSYAILELLNCSDNKVYLSKNRILNDELIQQLYSDTHFGTISKAINYCPSQDEFILSVKHILKREPSNLPQIMHVHQIFMQNIFDKLPFKSDNQEWQILKNTLVKKLFHNDLFKNSRIKVNNSAGELTRKIGISNDVNCQSDMVSTTELHQNVLGKFALNPNSTWGTIVTNNQLPFIAGPSGHIGSALLLAHLVGNLKDEELNTYLLANLGTLIGGGYHSADEIGVVANKTGFLYEPGKYELLIPFDFLCSKPMQTLIEKYPDLVSSKMCKPNPYLFLQPVFKETQRGIIRGMSNVMYDYSIQQGISKKTATALQLMFTYGGFFGTKCIEHYLLGETTQCVNTLYKAACDTGNMALIGLALKLGTHLIWNAQIYLEKQKWPVLSKGLSIINNLLPFGIFSYSAYSNQEPLTAVAAATLAGVGAEIITEKIGAKIIK